MLPNVLLLFMVLIGRALCRVLSNSVLPDVLLLITVLIGRVLCTVLSDSLLPNVLNSGQLVARVLSDGLSLGSSVIGFSVEFPVTQSSLVFSVEGLSLRSSVTRFLLRVHNCMVFFKIVSKNVLLKLLDPSVL